jgi:hypothetical protein
LLLQNNNKTIEMTKEWVFFLFKTPPFNNNLFYLLFCQDKIMRGGLRTQHKTNRSSKGKAITNRCF